MAEVDAEAEGVDREGAVVGVVAVVEGVSKLVVPGLYYVEAKGQRGLLLLADNGENFKWARETAKRSRIWSENLQC